MIGYSVAIQSSDTQSAASVRAHSVGLSDVTTWTNGDTRAPRYAIGLTYAGPVPLLPRILVGALLVLVGAALVTVAVLGARGRLPRNRWAGVRTPATLASDAAFALANRVAAAPLGAAGGVAVAGGLVTLAGGSATVVVLALTAVGTVALAGFGGLVGHRAADRHGSMELAPAPAGCAGVCAGCDLVAGCRGRVEEGATSPTIPDRP